MEKKSVSLFSRSIKPFSGAPSDTASIHERPNPIDTTANIYDRRAIDLNMLSPPITPVKRPAAEMPVPKMVFPPTPRASLEERPVERPSSTWVSTVPKPYLGRYSLGKQIGAGAWSNVAVADELPPLEAGRNGLTPPPSPNMRAVAKLLAIKRPNQKAADRVLTREARVLTYLFRDPKASKHIVSFHGQEIDTSSLILDFVPLTLSSYVAQHYARLCLSTSTMCDPVIGEAAWKALAHKLISSLAWLHSRGVAHGDIKGANILMRRRTPTPDDMEVDNAGPEFEPVFCDFSSALVDDEVREEREAADDAVTTTYASPELLESFRFSTRKFEKPVDRRKADVWATAICLILAATGGEPYAEARLSVQRTAMAKHGDVLGSVRGGTQGSRIMKGGFVAKTVAMALRINVADRIGAKEWKEALNF